MCEMKKYLPPSFFNAQEHYLIHQVEEIEKCGPVHTRSMWMVERHLKSLKALVRQRAHLEGLMAEGYMVYQTMVYIINIILKYLQILIWIASGMSNPSTNLKGSTYWGKVE